MASCLERLDQSGEALPRYEEAMELNDRFLPPSHPQTVGSQIGMAWTLVTLGRDIDAELLLLDAVEQCERSEASRRWHGRTVLEELIRLYEVWHAAEPNEEHNLKAAEWREKLTAAKTEDAD